MAALRFRPTIAALGLIAALPASAQQPFRAADGAFVCDVPSGWTRATSAIGTLPIGVFAPGDAGPERVLVFATTVVGTIEEVARQGAAFTTRTFPGVALQGTPLFGEGAQSHASGRYRVYGSTLYVEIDGGGPAVFAVEMPAANGLKIEGELYLRQ